MTSPAQALRIRRSWLGLVAIEAVVLGLLVWRPIVERRIDPVDIQYLAGRQYVVVLPRLGFPGYRLPGDTNDNPTQSSLVLLRDGQPLGPGHSLHDTIRHTGNGAFSHWGDVLYFSTPGNTDPRVDGHIYGLRATLTLDRRLTVLLPLGAVTIALVLLWAASGWLQIAWEHSAGRVTAMAGVAGRYMDSHRAPLRRTAGAFLVLLAGVGVFLMIWRPTVEAPIVRDQIVHVWGHTYSTRVPDIAPYGYRLPGDINDHPTQSSLVVLSDGQRLGPGHASHQIVRSDGHGAYSHSGDVLYFSTPGNTDPRVDGHVYVLRGRAILAPLPRALLSAALIVVGLLLVRVTGLWIRRPRAERPPRSSPGPVPTRFPVALLKLAALALVCATAPWGWLWPILRESDLLAAAGRFGLLAIYLAAVAASFAGLALVPFLRDWRIRVPLAVTLLMGFMADQVILSLSGQHMSLDMMQTLWRERAEVDGALAAYGYTILGQGMLAAVLGAIFLVPPAGRLALPPGFGIIPIAALATVAGVIHATNGRTEGFPSPYTVPAQLAIVQFASPTRDVERSPVEYGRALNPALNKIVMVVDESVRGDYLGLNNAKYDNTPFLMRARDALANYGTAISASNCSAGARLILRIGLQKHQLPDTKDAWRQLPTIWQFAHKAGYKTVLIDAWRPPGEFHSYMDQQEARAIDITMAANMDPTYARDPAVADMLVDLMQRDEAMFIYVNKQGVHREYHNRFPPDLAYDPSPLVAFLPRERTRRNAVRDYHKALRWSVDGFFQTLLPALQRSDAILIYTSDHGQSLFEGGYDLSHCSLTGEVTRGEVVVPLFTITGSSELGARLRAESQRAVDRASHFEVFPTLLELMGYSHDWVERVYGPSLLNVPVQRKRGFLMGTFTHPAARWMEVD